MYGIIMLLLSLLHRVKNAQVYELLKLVKRCLLIVASRTEDRYTSNPKNVANIVKKKER